MAQKEPIQNWKSVYKSLDEYYNNEFDPKYYHFDRLQRTIDPMETFEEIEAYSPEKRQQEMAKCVMSFHYWCQKYVKIAHPKRGLLSFITYRYQKNCIREYEQNRFCILSKFRQGGLTTVTTIWALWRCLFKLDETIMVLSKSDREAIAAGEIVKRAIIELPEWMKPQMEKNNDHQKLFADTGCKLFFYTPEAARGRSITYLIIDEAAFIANMEKHWKSMFPTISTGGHCICISTVNGVGNWYYDTFTGAQHHPPQNDFFIIELDYWEHPDYSDEEWIKSTRAQLGEKGWMQEVMRDFLGAGESFIPTDIINELDLITRDIEPIRKLFPQYNNLAEAKDKRSKELDSWVKGALQIWREPIEGREYIMGVDCAEGMDEDNDNSCFQIIDAMTCEQVAEFYSNRCPPHNFAQICAMMGHSYNNALIIVESMASGLTVLEKLQHDFAYDNLFESSAGGGTKTVPGIKTTKGTRPKFLETMQTRLINNSIAIRSRRFVKELKGFVWKVGVGQASGRAEATKGFHDDAILAMCFALYARDLMYRTASIAGAVDQDQYSESFKAEIFDNIKNELARGAPEDWMDSEEFDFMNMSDSDEELAGMFVRRKHHGILKEFGW